MPRIDTHHHMVPPDDRKLLREAGIDDAGGRAMPDCSPEGSLETMAEVGPFAPLEVAKLFTAGLENYPGIDADTRAAIDRGNALALFPRFNQ